MTVDVVDTTREPPRLPVALVATGAGGAPGAKRERSLRPLLFLVDATTLFVGWGCAVVRRPSLAHRPVGRDSVGDGRRLRDGRPV